MAKLAVVGSGKWVILGLLAAAVGCASADPQPQRGADEGTNGSVSLELRPVSGVTINAVNYVVTGTPLIPGATLPSGVLPTPGSDGSFHLGLSVPVGSGYTLSLTAASAETGDDITCTGAAGPFAIEPNEVAAITVTLTCVDNTTGAVIGGVKVETDACPRLIPEYALVSPSSLRVGTSGDLRAAAHDLDGKPIQYAWSVPQSYASVLSIANSTQSTTRITCAGNSGGKFPVTVTLSNGECQKSLSTETRCHDDRCGNGMLDPGESCDTAIPAGQPGGGQYGCPNDCTYVCGDGIVEAPAEFCELPNGVPTALCTAQCRDRLPICGDGFVTSPEQCDPQAPAANPPGTICHADCRTSTISDPACGDGIVSEGEECDPPSTSVCTDTCQRIVPDGCVACEAAGACGELSEACLAFTGADRSNCYAVAECIADTNCGDGANTLTSCFCGSLTTASCIAAPNSGPFAPAGICASRIRAAMTLGGGLPATNSEVLTRYIDPGFPGGAAIERYNCDKLDPACTDPCGFGGGGSTPPDTCPAIDLRGVNASTQLPQVGKSATLSALGNLPATGLTYSWSVPAAVAGAGSFSSTTDASTIFSCAAPTNDAFPVTLTVSNGTCSEQASIFIRCIPVPMCGNGVVDAGESCDIAITAGTPGGGEFGCPSDCTVSCGDGIIETPAEQCEPMSANDPACLPNCRNREAVCGDGFINGNEVCDGVHLPPGAAFNARCADDCLSIIGSDGGFCGDGIINGNETCEPPSSRTCSDDCHQVATAACVDCEQAGACGELSDACLAFVGDARTRCYDVQECISQTNCGDGAKTLTSCFCGNLTTASCIAAPNSGVGAPSGACADIIRTAMALGGQATPASNSEVLIRYIDSDVPGGAAIGRYNCDKFDPVCISVCGF